MKKLFFSKPFFPDHMENKMNGEGDLESSRGIFLKKRFANLDYLLKKRFTWMNDYIKPGMKVLEVGSGSGFSRLYINHPIILSDMESKPWIDKVVDATNINFNDSSIDVIIASHAIHHFYNPAIFLRECSRVLKKEGVILVSETYTSLMMRLILNLMKHEGYSYDVNVFDYETVCNDKKDPWSANCAIPELLFDNKEKFNNFFKDLQIEKQKFEEFLIFPLSGGVVSKIRMIELPLFLLKLVDIFDKALVSIFPSIFALGKKVVIRKR